MTVQEEDLLKREFISNMVNKFDYAEYKAFCLNNNLWLMSFVAYASLIEPALPVEVEQYNTTSVKADCGGCGGGTIR